MKHVLAFAVALLVAFSAHAQFAIQSSSIANNGSTGTVLNELVIATGAPSTATVATTSTTDGVIGICVGQCSTGGQPLIAKVGIALCAFDATSTVAGDWVQASSTSGGKCHDAGSSRPLGGQAIGIVLASGAGNANYNVDLTLGFTNTAGSGSGANPTATAGPTAVNGSLTTFMRSDAAPAVQKGTSSVFGLVESDGTTLTCTVGVCSLNLAHANAWTGSQRETPVNIAISTATFTPNFDTGQNFEIDLTSACPCTLANPSTTLVAGQSGIIEVHQDSAGSRTIGTWGTDYLYVGGTSTITLSTAGNSVDYVPYYVNNAATGIVLGTLLKAPVH